MTIFADDTFIKSSLTTADKKNSVICTLRDGQGSINLDFLRQDSKGTLVGRMVEPAIKPDWLVPGTILYGEVGGLKVVLTLEPGVRSRIAGMSQELGDKLKFSYVTITEFS